KSYLQRTMQILRPQIESGVPIVVLEPSCASVFRDELHNLFPDDRLAQKLKQQVFLLSEFLEKKADAYQLPRWTRKALVQGHCHHKAVLRFDDEKSVLGKLGLQYDLLTSGCCGMAGSFGFENEKYDVSVQIGERVLLPAVRKADSSTVIIADGFSCREQISQESNRQGLHLAEVIQIAKNQGGQMVDGNYPESELVKKRKDVRRKTRLRALVVVAGIATGALLLGRAATRH